MTDESQRPASLEFARRPVLQELFERCAQVMALDVGRQRLELIFEDGKLVRWFTHREAPRVSELGEYDDRAAWVETGHGEL